MWPTRLWRRQKKNHTRSSVYATSLTMMGTRYTVRPATLGSISNVTTLITWARFTATTSITPAWTRQSNSARTDTSERKSTKRPPPKSQKKKARPTDLGLNGHGSPEINSKHPQESVHTHQHRKSKSSHRPSQSISSQAPKRSPPYTQKTTNPHGHPPSPATTPSELPHEFEIHNYSSGFLDLYKEDGNFAISSNSFANLTCFQFLSDWLRDRRKLKSETGCDYEDVFQPLPPDVDSCKVTPQVRSKKLPIGSDTFAYWQYLASPQAVDKNVLLIELQGQIGIQAGYCQDPSSRWGELLSPLPFVFFHPLLPVCIDTRKEGSEARYVRRSCKPNATLDTYLSEDLEYHFWLVSDQPINANEQITISWDFRLPGNVREHWLQLLGLSDDIDKQPEFHEKETETYQRVAGWVHNILSEYGGCACDLGPECAFQRFHRTYIARAQGKEKASKQKKARKSKTGNLSPTNADHAMNSRAPSEARLEDGVENDSASLKSKPPSRDMTPAPRQGSFDTLGVLTELTDRDKRKVQMVEDSFRRMEQQQPPRKKKRTSDGSGNGSSGTSSKTKSKGVPTNITTTRNTTEGRYVDAGTSGSPGGSPISAVSPTSTNPPKQLNRRDTGSIPPRHSSQGPRPEYRDVAVQTEPVNGAWFSDGRPAQKPKRRVVSLSKRLLESRQRLRAEDDSRRASVAASPTSVTSALVKMDLDSPTKEQTITSTVSPNTESTKSKAKPDESTPAVLSEDVPMRDAPITSPPPAQATPVSGTTPPKSTKIKSPELRVQLPPVPAFNSPSPAGAAITPVSANESVVQSPFSKNVHSPFVPPPLGVAVVQPSPVKKKLSLSEYTKSRTNKAAAAKSSAALKPPTTAIVEEAKSPASADTVMSDSPTIEKGVEL
ncbi:hypothetical protein NPX13_g2559 [Xylaria arbuscula]|uniref:SET domain-containing protein n=1 Tax=Xylaria arbuscula TaxID=114810 RepID=A0A9W8TQZ1_9PEZI|nr:hypothetical protein NPX13_g2559 [Xylaria arbuscula]